MQLSESLKRNSLVAPAMLAVGLAVSPLAQGAATAFTDEAEFVAAAQPTIVESFEDEALAGPATSLTTSYFKVDITPLTGDYSGLVIGNSPGWASDGTQYLGAGAGGPNPWRIDITLDFPVYAVAFDVVSASEAPTQSGGTSVVRLDLPVGEQFVMSSCPPCLDSPGFPGNADYFFGIVSDTPFTTFSIINTAYSDGVGFDRMQFRPALVPEEMLQQLADSVEDIGPGKSLANTIELAQIYYDASDTQATCAVLVDFVDRVLKWSSTPMAKIESDLAGKLTSDAAALMGAIGCN